jgi:acetylornithine deacetylase/succinyl-diaminopimelate desuccinylase-like protein
VRVPGTANSARDVLITAHYDSVPVGPGAGDDFCPGVPTLLFPMSAHLQDRVRYGLLD